MKNYEKYADEIRKYKVSKGGFFCNAFIMPYILKKDSCNGVNCEHCHMLQTIWLLEDYEEPKEPEIDWSNVEVDTPIFVKNSEDEMWRKRHFAKYKNGNVYTWSNGFTSWTENYMASWKFAKLVEDEERGKEPKVDWSEVEVDTSILVRDYEDVKWQKRHFAKYENGFVYAWNRGCTSYTGADKIKWKYAKLTEDEKECKEPEVNWNKVEVDTPILVTNFEDSKWRKRYFAKFEDGKVYAWVDGGTSWSSDNKTHKWNYAKLAENEE